MKNAEFGVLFFGLGLTHTLSKQRNIDIAIKMIQDLNKYSKWGLTPMRGHFNVNGFNIFMAFETGFAFGVDFARGYTRYMLGETNTIDLLTRKEPDCFMVIAADPGAHFPNGANQHLADIPVIQVDIHWGPSTELADVVLPGSFIAVECAGTSYRMDGVPIYMKKQLINLKHVVTTNGLSENLKKES